MNLNSKLRSDSVFAQLTNEQIEMLEDWLFEEKLGYKEVIEKIQKEFGVKTSQTALGRYFRRVAEGRAQEWRIETIAQCLEALATAKGDGTLQAGLFAMANMHAVRLMTEEKPSFREITGWLRAMTSAGAFEMKRVEIYETKEKERLAEIERKEKEAREAEKWAEESKKMRAMYDARYQKCQATRKANLAKKEAMENEKLKMKNEKVGGTGMVNDQAPKARVEGPERAVVVTLLEPEKSATSPRPNGFPSPPRVSFPRGDEHFVLRGPPEAERVTDGAASVAENSGAVAVAKPQTGMGEPPKGGTPNTPKLPLLNPAKRGTPAGLLGQEGLIEGVDFTINWAGHPEKPLKTH